MGRLALAVSRRRARIDAGPILDAWHEPRRHHRIVLHAFAPPFAGHGFIARAIDRSGHRVLERYFLETNEGLEAMSADAAGEHLSGTRDRASRPSVLRWLLKASP